MECRVRDVHGRGAQFRTGTTTSRLWRWAGIGASPTGSSSASPRSLIRHALLPALREYQSSLRPGAPPGSLIRGRRRGEMLFNGKAAARAVTCRRTTRTCSQEAIRTSRSCTIPPRYPPSCAASGAMKRYRTTPLRAVGAGRTSTRRSAPDLVVVDVHEGLRPPSFLGRGVEDLVQFRSRRVSG